jgi:predicted nucleic acid-binding protein
VVSELVAQHPGQNVIQWVDSVDPASLYLIVITIGEINKGIEKLPESKRKARLQDWLEQALLVRFRDHILPINASIILGWGRLLAMLEMEGYPLPAIDSWLAATALQLGFVLVTRNISDFAAADIELLYPWMAGAD